MGHVLSGLRLLERAGPHAQTAFYDEGALLRDDPDHSEVEDRFVLLGFSAALRLLIVCHCLREAGTSSE